ncbi:kinase-like domain-containing protein [Daedaleopsis nitida]|nr:kinase-like domain-containing protein [Daedaleopsis nitida]
MFKERTFKRHPYYWENLLGGLYDDEYLWRDHAEWLAESGYVLRPRYRKDWEPSWLKTKKGLYACEDGESTILTVTLDAVRISDGRIVSLKRVKKSHNPTEERILRYLNQERLATDPTNHTVLLYETLQSPLDTNLIFLVMPYLAHIFPVKFATVGEAVECMRQLFEGLKFIHSHRIAHADISRLNVLMDPTPLYSDIPHPTHPERSYNFKRRIRSYTRTDRPTHYYYIDFGLSVQFPEGQETISPINFGGDRSVPEFKEPSGMYNPFKADIYTLGNLVRQELMEKSACFEFMSPLVADMTTGNPEDRPSIEEAVRRFEEIRASLPWQILRSRFVYRDELSVCRLYRACRHVVRTIVWAGRQTPSLPTP